MMQCFECKLFMKEIDFMGKDKCYKCQYKGKLKIPPKKRCKKCNLEITKSNRWKYCGKECADIAAKEMKKNGGWAEKLRINSQKYDWHDYRG